MERVKHIETIKKEVIIKHMNYAIELKEKLQKDYNLRIVYSDINLDRYIDRCRELLGEHEEEGWIRLEEEPMKKEVIIKHMNDAIELKEKLQKDYNLRLVYSDINLDRFIDRCRELLGEHEEEGWIRLEEYKLDDLVFM